LSFTTIPGLIITLRLESHKVMTNPEMMVKDNSLGVGLCHNHGHAQHHVVGTMLSVVMVVTEANSNF